MGIEVHHGTGSFQPVTSPETMYGTIARLGIVPFFVNDIPGFSIEELTPGGLWFDDDQLGPWDWKIFCVQSGDIAYGKFLRGKAAFATVEWYRELRNYRLSLPKYVPDERERQILTYLDENGSIGIKEVRGLMGIKKSAADSLITRLQMQCRVVTGDIVRVYRGADLHYNGWQTSSFCKPESLFSGGSIPGPGGFPFVEDMGLETGHSPEESRDLLVGHIKKIAPQATGEQILKLLG